MKHLTTLIPVAAALAGMMLTGCVRGPRNLEPYGWEAVDPAFDSLTVQVENLLIDNAPRDSVAVRVAAMRRLADSHPGIRVMNSRATFFEGQMAYTFDDSALGDSLRRVALELTDSARYPYDALRIRYFLDDDYHEPSVEYYEHLRGQLDGFMKSGDKLWSAGLAMETGMFLVDLGDTRHGEEYLDTADSLLRAGGFRMQLSSNRINRANLLRERKDTAGAVALMRETLADTVNPVQDLARHILLGNLYSLAGDTAALHEAYRLVSNYTNSSEFECLYASSLASEKVRARQLDSARFYRAAATRSLIEDMPAETLLAYYDASRSLFDATGRTDSAYRYLSLADSLRRRQADDADRAEINNITLYSRIERMRLDADLARRNVVIASLGVILAILLAGGVAALLFYRRIQSQKLARVEDTLARERSERKALAMETVLAEKENLMRGIERETDRLIESGEITRAAAGKIRASVKVHVSQREQRDSFVESFENLSPDFALRLREAYPSLTEADVRLAAYIAMGMENKHIARVMAIRPESVKQARWRLRGKLGLASGESLDDLMRRFASRE